MQVESALDTMLFLGWIEEDPESNSFKVLARETINYVNIDTSMALKKLQADANTLSMEALKVDDISKRYHSSNTIAIDSSKIEKAKKMMRDFHQKFAKAMDREASSPDSVYHLNVSFYRIDRGNIED